MLYVKKNNVGSEGAKAIGEGLKTNSSLTQFDLGSMNNKTHSTIMILPKQQHWVSWCKNNW